MIIQMWITPISYSNRSAAVIAEAIEVDSKPFKCILPFEVSVTCACINKLHCLPCLLCVKNCFCNKFSWVPLPTKTF